MGCAWRRADDGGMGDGERARLFVISAITLVPSVYNAKPEVSMSALVPYSHFTLFHFTVDKFKIKHFCSWQGERPSSSAFCALLASECKN